MSLVEVAIKILIELMKTGRVGLLADRPVEGGKAYITILDADDITNWNTASGREYIVLKDCNLIPDAEDEYDLQHVEGFRELTRDKDGNYIIRIWRQKEKSEEYYIDSIIRPTKGLDRPLDFIPFTCIGDCSARISYSGYLPHHGYIP